MQQPSIECYVNQEKSSEISMLITYEDTEDMCTEYLKTRTRSEIEASCASAAIHSYVAIFNMMQTRS